MDRAQKQSEVDMITKRLQSAQVALCADYRGLTVAEITTLRRELRKGGSVGKVVKNTLAKIASKKVLGDAPASDIEKFLALFEGPSMLIVSDKDPVTPAKAIADFIKDKKKLTIKGAWLDGKFLDQQGVDALAKMPGKEQILAQLLALINTPATQLLRLMQTPGTQVTRVIEAHRSVLSERQG